MKPDAVVVYPSKGKLLLITLGTAALVAIGLFLYFVKSGDRTAQVVLLVCTAALVVPLFYGLVRLMRPSPALIIHPTGIFDNASALSAGFLRWDEILGMAIVTMGRQRFLALTVNDLDGVLRRQSGIKAGLMKINVALVGAAVNIPANTLPLPLEEVVQEILRKCPAMVADSTDH